MTSPSLAVRLTISVAFLALMTGCSSVSLPGGTELIKPAGEDALRAPTAARPEPDSRGVISYPNYQVAVARAGDTVQSIATRLGLDARALATSNGLPVDATLSVGELVLLPTRVAAETAVAPIASAPGSTQTAIAPAGAVDVATLAGTALDRTDGKTTTTTTTAVVAPIAKPAAPAAPKTLPKGAEPIRHKVVRGDTAYSIARKYNVSVRALADWNGLDSALTVREGQILLIPVAVGPAPAADTATVPGTGTKAPEPPSASEPLPKEDLPPAAATAKEPAPVVSPAIAAGQTAASDTTKLQQPVAGKIIRAYSPGKNEGVDFGAPAGTPVHAADGGTVAAITRDVDQVPIIVLRHPGNLLTVYANVDNITVKKGDTVKRGQTIAEVRAGEPSFLHFEVRNGFDSVDPVSYLSK